MAFLEKNCNTAQDSRSAIELRVRLITWHTASRNAGSSTAPVPASAACRSGSAQIAPCRQPLPRRPLRGTYHVGEYSTCRQLPWLGTTCPARCLIPTKMRSCAAPRPTFNGQHWPTQTLSSLSSYTFRGKSSRNRAFSQCSMQLSRIDLAQLSSKASEACLSRAGPGSWELFGSSLPRPSRRPQLNPVPSITLTCAQAHRWDASRPTAGEAEQQ